MHADLVVVIVNSGTMLTACPLDLELDLTNPI